VGVTQAYRSRLVTQEPKDDTSTNILCLRASGRASGVPDVPTGGWQNAPGHVLTAYLTAYRLENSPPNAVECALV